MCDIFKQLDFSVLFYCLFFFLGFFPKQFIQKLVSFYYKKKRNHKLFCFFAPLTCYLYIFLIYFFNSINICIFFCIIVLLLISCKLFYYIFNVKFNWNKYISQKSDKISLILKIFDYKHKIYLIYLKKIFFIILRIYFFF